MEVEFPVFVYGTLRKGAAANHILNGARHHSRTKTDFGYRLAKMGDLPGMIFTGEASQVVGDLYYLSTGHFKRLNAYEDRRYIREKIPLESGLWAHAYLLPRMDGEATVEDWRS